MLSLIRSRTSYLDFDLCISFSVVNSNNRSGHFWDNDHISQLGLYNVGFLIWWCFLLLLSQLFDQSHRLSFQSTAKLTANSAWEKFHKLLIVHIKQLVEVDSPVGKLPEGTPLLQLGSLKIRWNHSLNMFLALHFHFKLSSESDYKIWLSTIDFLMGKED